METMDFETMQWHLPGPQAARETLICLHCSASSGRQWAGLAEFVGDDVDVLTPDLLGYADPQAWPAGMKLTLDDEVDALAPLLGAHPGGVHLLGHSYGGAVALQIAMRWPERVKSLTLYEPVRLRLLFDQADMAPAANEALRLARKVLATAEVAPGVAGLRFVDYWSGAGAWDRTSPARQRAVALRMRKVAAEFGAVLEDTAGPADYARLTMPVHLLGGDGSPAPVQRVLDCLAKLLPYARRVTLCGLGHMGPVEAPERVALALPARLLEAGRGSAEGHRRGRADGDERAAPLRGGQRWAHAADDGAAPLHSGQRWAHAVVRPMASSRAASQGAARPLLAWGIAAVAFVSSLLFVGPLPATGAGLASPPQATVASRAGPLASMPPAGWAAASPADSSVPAAAEVLASQRDAVAPEPVASF